MGTNNAANGVKVIDINAGIIDAASSTPFYGVRSMFNNPTADGLHPNAQGDLLMAGNLAKGMGYAGRSAGQERKATHELEVNFDKIRPSPSRRWRPTASPPIMFPSPTIQSTSTNPAAAPDL